jgi:hypothetical protein
MERINLKNGRFPQADVLRIVPELSAKTLQNWVDPKRKIIPFEGDRRPGRQGKILWTASGVICLSFMSKIVPLGISPRAAWKMSGRIEEHAHYIHDVWPVIEEKGRLIWSIPRDQPELQHRGFIVRYEGEHSVILEQNRDAPNEHRPLLPDVYVTVEVDRLILGALNRIYAFLAGVDVRGQRVLTFPPEATEEEKQVGEKVARWLDKIDRPGADK